MPDERPSEPALPQAHEPEELIDALRKESEAVEPTDQEKLALVSQVLDLIPDFFYVHDYDMRFWYANRKAAEYFGRTKDDIIGRRLQEVDPNKLQAAFFEDVCKEVMRAGTPRLTDNLPYTRSDGSRGVLRQHDIPFINPKTGELMLMGISRDVTAERELEQERLARAALERELEIAREIQQALRPAWDPRGIVGLELVGSSRPAAYAGGDFYDWFPLADGRVMLLMGDVTGHGVGPAMLAAACRAYARVVFTTEDLVAGVRRLGELLAPDLGDGRFITLATAMLEPSGRAWTARVLSAGHGPILLRRCGKDGVNVEDVAVQAAPLGVMPIEHGVSAEKLTLHTGDALVLTSDGVIESRAPSGGMFGSARLRQLLRDAGAASGGAIGGLITRSVDEFTAGAPAQDDVTILIAGATEH